MIQMLVYGALAVGGGYFAVVLAYLVMTFGLTSLSPKFVMQRGHFTPGYIFIHPLIWAISGLLGGYVTANIAENSVMLIIAALAVLIAFVVLKHGGASSRQTMRGKAMQAILAVVGVGAGGYLALL